MKQFSSDFPARLLATATSAALKAGAHLKSGFGSSFTASSKEGWFHNLVTKYDKESEALIIEHIKNEYKDHNFMGEEGGLVGAHNDTVLWIIDPLDGTVNFAHGIPMFSVSIAATYKSEVLCGVVYHPLLSELFTAEKNHGAYLNGSRISVSKINKLEESFLSTGFPYNLKENPLNCIEHFLAFSKIGLPIRRIGSAALDLAYLAAGRYDGFWEVSLQPWDYAAGKLLLEEAGGIFTSYTGEPYHKFIEGSVIASNGLIHDQILHTIQTARK